MSGIAQISLALNTILALKASETPSPIYRVKNDKFYEKYAWILLFTVGIFRLFFGLSALVANVFSLLPPLPSEVIKSLTGINWDDLVGRSPGVAALLKFENRAFAIREVGFNAFAITMAGVPYRRGARWAWYTLLVWPIIEFGGLLNALSANDVSAIRGTSMLLLLTVLGLLLPMRKFFLKKPTVEA